jgi:large subunit ribosomal protein L22
MPSIQNRATAKYIRISPSKIQKVLNLIRGKSYKEVLDIFQYLPQKSVAKVWQVLYSAISNATQTEELLKENLMVVEAYVNRGPILKRMQPHARGKSFKIEKKMCHITIVVAERPRN